MAEPGSNAAPSTTDKTTFHGLIMNTLNEIEELPRDPDLLCRDSAAFVNRAASIPDGSATGRRSKHPTGAQVAVPLRGRRAEREGQRLRIRPRTERVGVLD